MKVDLKNLFSTIKNLPASWRLISILSLLLGLMLFGINISSFFIDPNEQIREPIIVPGFEKAPPGYFYSVRPLSDLEEFIKNSPQDPNLDWLVAASSVIAATLTHEARFIKFYENWLLWGAGKFFPSFERPLKGDLVIKGGRGNCTEATFVLMQLADQVGLANRYLHIKSDDNSESHSISEVKLKGKWLVVDADFGIVYPVALDILYESEGIKLIEEALGKADFPPNIIGVYKSYFSGQDNDATLPAGYVPKITRVHEMAGWLKWLIPILLVMFSGCYLFLKTKKFYPKIINFTRTKLLKKKNITILSISIVMICLALYIYIDYYRLSYRIKARQEDPQAEYNLALLSHNEGRKEISRHKDFEQAKMNFQTALDWLSKSAEQGFMEAQFTSGIIYYRGWWGQSRDYNQALSWFTRAAEQGDDQAQFFIGKMYEQGLGVTQDYEKAMNWYQQSAAAGNVIALGKVADMSEKGLGNPKDEE